MIDNCFQTMTPNINEPIFLSFCTEQTKERRLAAFVEIAVCLPLPLPRVLPFPRVLPHFPVFYHITMCFTPLPRVLPYFHVFYHTSTCFTFTTSTWAPNTQFPTSSGLLRIQRSDVMAGCVVVVDIMAATTLVISVLVGTFAIAIKINHCNLFGGATQLIWF